MLCDRLAVPGLSVYGVSESAFPNIIEKSARASSMKGNPIRLSRDELQDILAQAM